jgi:glycosyltransferase involved in cell wall biosynthesis
VVIPVLDEAAALPLVLEGLPSAYRAIVVDNGSTDGSGRVAASLGAEVVTEPRRGFGAACWAGLMATTGADRIVCFMDGDASLDAADLDAVAGPVLAGDIDLMLGTRRAVEARAWPAHARIANRLLAREIGRRTGVRVTDIGPMRAATRAGLVELGLIDRGFGWPLEMVLRAAVAGWRIGEVGVDYRPRVGRSKVTGTVRGTAQAVRDMGRILRQVPSA